MLKIKRFDPLKFARTEKPKEASKFKVPPHITSTKGQQKKQKFLNKFLRKEQTANKSPLERGETIPRGRIRHCPCGKIMSAVCVRKGHMVGCSKHPQNYTIPGHLCPECEAKEDKRAHQAAQEIEVEKQRVKKEEESTWYCNHYERKKPSIKFADQPAAEARVGLV